MSSITTRTLSSDTLRSVLVTLSGGSGRRSSPLKFWTIPDKQFALGRKIYSFILVTNHTMSARLGTTLKSAWLDLVISLQCHTKRHHVPFCPGVPVRTVHDTAKVMGHCHSRHTRWCLLATKLAFAMLVEASRLQHIGVMVSEHARGRRSRGVHLVVRSEARAAIG